MKVSIRENEGDGVGDGDGEGDDDSDGVGDGDGVGDSDGDDVGESNGVGEGNGDGVRFFSQHYRNIPGLFAEGCDWYQKFGQCNKNTPHLLSRNPVESGEHPEEGIPRCRHRQTPPNSNCERVSRLLALKLKYKKLAHCRYTEYKV